MNATSLRFGKVLPDVSVSKPVFVHWRAQISLFPPSFLDLAVKLSFLKLIGYSSLAISVQHRVSPLGLGIFARKVLDDSRPGGSWFFLLLLTDGARHIISFSFPKKASALNTLPFDRLRPSAKTKEQASKRC